MIKWILYVGLYLSLIRATNINLFYPADEQQLKTIDYTFQILLNYVLITGVVGYLFLSNNYRYVIRTLMRPGVLMVTIPCLLSVVFSVDPGQSMKFLFAIVAITMFSVFFWLHYGTSRLFREYARFTIFLVFACIAYIVAMPQYGIMTAEHEGSWRGLFEHKNVSGPYFAVGLFFIIDQLRRRGFRLPIVAYGAIAACIVMTLMSHSTTAIVCLVFTAAMYGCMAVALRVRNPTERVAIVMGVLASGIVVLVFGTALLMQMFFDATGKDATLTGRTNIWAPLIKLSYDSPLVGYGMGMAQRPEFIARIHGSLSFEAASTHNSVLDLVLNIGYPGTVLFILIVLGRYFRTLALPFRERKDWLTGTLVLSLMPVIIVNGLTSADNMLGRSVFSLLLMVSLMCCTSLIEKMATSRQTRREIAGSSQLESAV